MVAGNSCCAEYEGREVLFMIKFAIYSVVILALFLISRWRIAQMFYYPDRTVYDTPAAHGLHFEEVTFPSQDGTRLSGWFIPAVGTAKGTVIHFHGNAENMTSHFGFVSWLPAAGFNLFVFDYRGYGTSAGRPDRQGVYRDSLAALEYVRSRKDLERNRLLLLGQSLGGAQAIAIAGGSDRQGIRAVVSDSSFYSYRDIVRDKIAAMPLLSLIKTPLAHVLIGNELSPADYIGRIAPVPLLLIHGTHDEVIPYSHGERLYESAGQPKSLWRIEEGGHTEALFSPDSPERRRLVEFFDAALLPPEPKP